VFSIMALKKEETTLDFSVKLNLKECCYGFTTITPTFQVFKEADESHAYTLDETYFITISRRHLRSYMEAANILRLHDEGQFHHNYTLCKNGVQIQYSMSIKRNENCELVVNLHFQAIKEELDEEPAEKKRKTSEDPSFYGTYFLQI